MNTVRKLRQKHRNEPTANSNEKLLHPNNRLESAVTIEENISTDSDSEISGLQMK